MSSGSSISSGRAACGAEALRRTRPATLNRSREGAKPILLSTVGASLRLLEVFQWLTLLRSPASTGRTASLCVAISPASSPASAAFLSDAQSRTASPEIRRNRTKMQKSPVLVRLVRKLPISGRGVRMKRRPPGRVQKRASPRLPPCGSVRRWAGAEKSALHFGAAHATFRLRRAGNLHFVNRRRFIVFSPYADFH